MVEWPLAVDGEIVGGALRRQLTVCVILIHTSTSPPFHPLILLTMSSISMLEEPPDRTLILQLSASEVLYLADIQSHIFFHI